MSKKIDSIALPIVFVLLLLSFAEDILAQNAVKSAAQKTQTKSESKESSAAVEFNLPNGRIIDVLRETADNAKTWEDSRSSAEVQAQAADLIWSSQPIFAETILRRAWERAKEVKESKEKSSRFRNSSIRVEAGREVLLVARKRNPEVAKKWLEELAELTESDFAERHKGVFDDRTARSAVLLQMAMQIAKDNPEAAASLATESLRDGISFGLQNVLIAIQENKPELAQTVFRAALQRVQNVGISDPNEILILYSYLYTPGRISSAGNSDAQGGLTIAVGRERTGVKAAADLNPALAREFLQISAQALLRLPPPQTMDEPEKNARAQAGVLNTIAARLGNDPPELAEALRERLNTIYTVANYKPESRWAPEGKSPPRTGETVKDYRSRLLEEAVAQAEKLSNPLERDIAFAKAVVRTEVAELERAFEIAGKIDDKELRLEIYNFLRYRAALYYVKNDDLQKAEELIDKNSNARQKAATLIVGGQNLLKKKDSVRAADWLLAAQKLWQKNKSENETDWSRIGFGLSSALVQTDVFAALSVFRETAKTVSPDFSDLDQAPLAIAFTGLDFSDFSVGTAGFGLKTAVAAFPANRFEDVLTGLKIIKNDAVKGVGILILCRKNLSAADKKPASSPPNKKRT